MTDAAEEKWYNLSEMSRLTGINRAQLHKYVKSHPDRILSQRFGARTKFHESGVVVFEEIRKEGLRRVGKPVTERAKIAPSDVKRKPGRRAAQEDPQAAPRYYTLADMARLTGINRVQLHKLSRTYANQIPSRKVGGRTQYPSEAAEVFRQLRDQRRISGPRPGMPAPSRRAEETAPAETNGSKAEIAAETSAPPPASNNVETKPIAANAIAAPGGADATAPENQAFEALALAIRFLAAPPDVQATVRVLLERAERS